MSKFVSSTLSKNSKNILMQNLYYSPETQFTSIRSLYQSVKNKGITQDEVREFLKNQESSQLYQKAKRIKHYFPIVARHKFEILQLDLLDMSDIASANENYRYLVVAVDVFSRLAFVIPIKNRRTETIIDALEEIIEVTEPSTINSDHEFTSNAIKKFFTERGIDMQIVDVGDHHKLGIVDRFCRTIREKINKYLTMYNTTKYIDVLPKLVYNYNTSYHSGIRKAPSEVEDEDEKVNELTNRKYNRAKREETIFQIGDTVRYIINKRMFEKGTLPHWSKTTHKIINKNEHSYVLDNGKTYKYYELQLVEGVDSTNTTTTEPTREQLRKERTNMRRFRKEGLDENMILD